MSPKWVELGKLKVYNGVAVALSTDWTAEKTKSDKYN
jgi:hypothetical protein